MKDAISKPENAAIIEKLNSLVHLRLLRRGTFRQICEWNKVLDGEPDNPDDICSPIDVKDYGGDITAFEKRQREKSPWVVAIKECAASYSGEYSADDDYRNCDEYDDDDEYGRIKSWHYDYESVEIAECREELHKIRHSLPQKPYKKDLIQHKCATGFYDLEWVNSFYALKTEYSYYEQRKVNYGRDKWATLLAIFIPLAVFGAILAAALSTTKYYWIGLLLDAPLVLCGVAALVVAIAGGVASLGSLIKTLIVNIKIDKQNVQFAVENKRQFEADMCVYKQQVEELYKEYKEQLDKTREAVRKRVVLLKQRTAEERDRANRAEEAISGTEYDFYDIRDYSVERLENIVRLLSSGRADSYKEALNMCIAQEEQEARDEEERLWREEQAEEEREWREEQAESERRRERDRQQKEEIARATAERDARRRCWSCIHSSKCSKYGAINCSSYIPK